jgi:hypothetical protein
VLTLFGARLPVNEAADLKAAIGFALRARVTRAGVLSGNRQMLERWWDVLGYGDSSFWRIWKGPSPFAAK